MNYNDCDIVFDLLPLYLDGKTGAESNEFIGEHLAECVECRKVHRLMSAEVFMSASDDHGTINQANENLGQRRKHRMHIWRKWIILVVGLFGYICLMIGIVWYTYWTLTKGGL